MDGRGEKVKRRERRGNLVEGGGKWRGGGTGEWDTRGNEGGKERKCLKKYRGRMQMERRWNSNGTQMERKRNANGTQMERKWNANGTQTA